MLISISLVYHLISRGKINLKKKNELVLQYNAFEMIDTNQLSFKFVLISIHSLKKKYYFVNLFLSVSLSETT